MILLLCAALLSGCGSGAENRASFLEFQERLLQAETLDFTVRITADLEDRVETFTVDCRRERSSLRLTITEPELLSGISARVEEDGARLEYDGVILDVGTVTTQGLTPMSALPVILSAGESGHLEQLWREKLEDRSLLAARLDLTDRGDVTLYLDSETLAPVCAEIQAGERTVLRCDFIRWTWN